MRKVLVVGLDGATWDVIDPLCKEGKLPTFSKLIRGGVKAKLISTIPPVTGPSWFSFATGRNPGNTGVFDFCIRKENQYEVRPINSQDFFNKAVWDYLSEAGKKVGVVMYPMLYPPYKVNGFVVSGMGAPWKENITFPKELKGELERLFGEFELYIEYHHPKYNDVDLFFKDVGRVLEKHKGVVQYLLKKEWEFFIVVFSITDWVQHLAWRYFDKNHPLYTRNESEKYGEKFIEFWQKIDEILSEILSSIDKETNLFIVSDHGFGPQDECFNLANWLEKEGYLVRKRRIREDILNSVKNFFGPFRERFRVLKRLFPSSFSKKVSTFLDTKANIVRGIDFQKSKAYCLGHTIPFGAIYLNKEILDEEECEVLKQEITKKLKNLKKELGENIQVTIFDPAEIYFGEHVKEAPDIIFTIDNWRCIIMKSFGNFIFRKEPFSPRHTGSHRLEGIFVAFGPDVKKGYEIDSIKIWDVIPTILHIFDVPLPGDMDGKVLKEIFKVNSEVAKKEIKYEEEKIFIKRRIRELKKIGKI
jgi:predicted AlkP superfamily phosphohydrolase/phosphomutase